MHSLELYDGLCPPRCHDYDELWGSSFVNACMVQAGVCVLVYVFWAVNRSEDVLFNRRAFIRNLKSDNNTHREIDRHGQGQRAAAAACTHNCPQRIYSEDTTRGQ